MLLFSPRAVCAAASARAVAAASAASQVDTAPVDAACAALLPPRTRQLVAISIKRLMRSHGNIRRDARSANVACRRPPICRPRIFKNFDFWRKRRPRWIPSMRPPLPRYAQCTLINLTSQGRWSNRPCQQSRGGSSALDGWWSARSRARSISIEWLALCMHDARAARICSDVTLVHVKI